jgi:hypothetical protein
MSWIEKSAHGVVAVTLVMYFTGVLSLYPAQQDECSTSCALLFPTCMAFVISAVRLVWKLTEHPGEKLHIRETVAIPNIPVVFAQDELPYVPE